MDYIDILQLLQLNNGTLKGVVVYGYIRSRLNRPSNLFDSCREADGGMFVQMTALCVNLSGQKEQLQQMGIWNGDGNYFVNGSIALYVSKQGKYPDWYKSKIDLRLGGKSDSSYVIGFDFKRNSRGDWLLDLNSLGNVRASEFNEGRIQSALMKWADIPAEVFELPKMSCIYKGMHDIQRDEGTFDRGSVVNTEVVGKDVENSEKLESTLLSVQEKSVMYGDLDKKCDVARGLGLNFVEDLKKRYKGDTTKNIVLDLLHKINANINNRIGNATGSKVIIEYLQSNYAKLSAEKSSGVHCDKFMVTNFDEVIRYVETGENTIFTGMAERLLNSAFSSPEYIYCGIVSSLINVSLRHACRVCSRLEVSTCEVLRNNPMILYMLGCVSFKEAEKLYRLFGADHERFRNVCILHDYLMQSGNDTLFIIDAVRKSGVPFRVTKSQVENGMTQVFKTAVAWLDTNPTWYKESEFRKEGFYYVKRMIGNEFETCLHDMLELGFGVSFDRYITTTDLLAMELFVYEKLWGMSQEVYPYISDRNAYEADMGITLEEEQANAYKLLEHGAGVLTGSAGSGKTTTVKYMVHCLRTQDDRVVVQYGAPTGKAAKVLQKSVKEKAKTIHSLCGLDLSAYNGLLDGVHDEDDDATNSKVVYIFDEMSMVTVELLYRLLNKVDTYRIYFVGDIHQLNAIGKGMVLKNLLRFLPRVCLRGSKRFKGGIVANSQAILNEEPLQDYDDFKLIKCPNEAIHDTVLSIVKHYLGITPYKGGSLPAISVDKDNIQVITPFVKDKYPYGAKTLNKDLQILFNNTGNDRFIMNNQTFIIGDRVIHTNRNSMDMQWYSTWQGGKLQKIYGNGVANGEVGKLVGLLDSRRCSIEKEQYEQDFEYPEDLRDDSNWDGMFIVVEYYDYIEDIPFYILYRGTVRSKEGGQIITGEDTYLLDLFYAGSVHKMQGSQAELLICCLGAINFPGFITKNMVYTMVTRAEKAVIMIGSVGNEDNSMLSVACKDVADEGVLTVGEMLCSQN